MGLRVGGVALAALIAAAAAQGAVGQTMPSPAAGPTGPVGRWIGAGVQVDWLGNPLELPRIVVEIGPGGDGRIDYPSLGCAGLLTRLGAAADGAALYRETLTSGTDECASGGYVSLRPAGDRWVYSWSIETDWRTPEAMASLGLPGQPGAGPDGDWVRSGVLTADPAPGRAFAPRDPAASAEAHAERLEHHMLPPVLVAGETPAPVSLAERMAALHVPGVSIAVIHHGRIDWARSYGVARPDGAPVTPETLFQAASISKPVTALTTLAIAQQKLVDLDVDVDTYLHGWRLPRDADAAGRVVSLRDLLTHTAGVTVHGFAGYAPGAPLPSIDQILQGAAPANSGPVRVDTAPGVLWRYSGGGYVVIRKALQDVTGQPFAELARRYVLAPAGMTHSLYAQPLPAALAASAAAPYGADGKALPEGAHTYPEMTPDGLWTTPTDLAKLALHIQGALAGGADGPLSPAMTREMLDQGGLANWGLGWGLGGSGDSRYFWHSGSNAGFKSMLFAYADGEGVAIMTNSDAGEKLAAEIVRTLAYEYGWADFRPYEIAPVAVSPAQLDALVGRYRTGRFGSLTITRKEGQLFAQPSDGPAFRLYPRSATEWFAIDPDGFTPDPDTQLAFRLGPDGAVTAVTLRKGYDTVAARLDAAAAARLDAALAARVAAAAPAPGAEAAMRRYIAGMQAGAPDYATLDPGAAYISRLLLLNFADDIAGLGKLESLTFKGVAPNGADLFVATFEHGAANAMILQDEDGHIEQAMLMSPGFM
jgi:CubicO group peptidase (beta-lactamase class C family)